MNKPKSSKRKTREVDLHLAVAATLNQWGYDWSLCELGRFCGVSHEAMRIISDRAIRKCQKALREIITEEHGGVSTQRVFLYRWTQGRSEDAREPPPRPS